MWRYAGPPALVYPLGVLGTDFGTEARRDSLIQAGIANPHDPSQLAAHFDANAPHSGAVIWTLNQEQAPIYALQPMGAFAAHVYERLREFLKAWLTQGVERVSVPGFIAGSVSLLNGQIVPTIVPELRGMFSWSTPRLVEAVAGPRPRGEERRGSDCWDVSLTFFNPSRRLEQARRVYRFSVDVSDVIPVTVGKVRHWDVY